MVCGPNYVENLIKKWNPLAQIPKGDNPYTLAKKAQTLEKDYAKAEQQ
jgi:hypothetical protein